MKQRIPAQQPRASHFNLLHQTSRYGYGVEEVDLFQARQLISMDINRLAVQELT